MVIFHSYVSLPEGIQMYPENTTVDCRTGPSDPKGPLRLQEALLFFSYDIWKRCLYDIWYLIIYIYIFICIYIYDIYIFICIYIYDIYIYIFIYIYDIYIHIYIYSYISYIIYASHGHPILQWQPLKTQLSQTTLVYPGAPCLVCLKNGYTVLAPKWLL